MNDHTSRPETDPQYVIYFVKDNLSNRVKIGITSDLHVRLSSLKAKHGGQLELIGLLPGDRDTEKTLHLRFAEFHIGNEWFTPSEEIAQFVKDHTSLDGDLHIAGRIVRFGSQPKFDLLNVSAAAKYLGVSRAMLYRYRRQNILPYKMLNGLVCFIRVSLDELRDKGKSIK